MSGPRYQVHFLAPNATVASQDGKASTNRRSLELARSEARSHAARVSHPGTNARRPSTRKIRIQELTNAGLGSPSLSPESEAASTETSPTSSSGRSDVSVASAERRLQKTSLPILKFRLHVDKGKDAHVKASQTSQNKEENDLAKRGETLASVPAQIPKEISKSALDPFVIPPLELSVADEHLLHLYLSSVPDQIYGSAAPDVSAVIRHGTVGVVETNQLVVMWLLLVLESHVVSFQPTKRDRQLSILTRRSAVFKLMNERLLDPESSLKDDYILAVACAGASEHRLGNTRSAQHHVSAARNLLELRGGLQSLRHVTYPLNLMIINIFIEQGVDGLWKTQDELLSRVATLARWIRDAQAWNFSFRSHVSSHWQLEDCPTPDSVDGCDLGKPSAIHHSRRARAFAHKTALSDYIALPPGGLNNAQYRFYFGILFALNWALYAFRDSEVTTTTYLMGITTAVEASALHNFTLRAGGAKLPSLLLLLMIAHNAVNTGERDEFTSVVFHVEEVSEMVEVMMMTTSNTRMRVLRAFESWLTTPIERVGDLAFVNIAEFDILAGEVQEAWLSAQGG